MGGASASAKAAIHHAARSPEPFPATSQPHPPSSLDPPPLPALVVAPLTAVEPRLRVALGIGFERGRWAGLLIAGLGFIHTKGYVHRDVKSGNIFLSPDGHLTLLDFGVLRDEANFLRETMRSIPALTDIQLKDSPGKPELEVEVDRDEAARVGLPAGAVGLGAVPTAFSDGPETPSAAGG